MTSTQIISLIGLGFGDCGKGLFTDHLCRTLSAHTVVRFNGGAQAGHNVVLTDGRHHTFSQFGAGTFNRGVHTLLAHPVIVHPTALLIESDVLTCKGIVDPLRRLIIDERCRITTPFHQAAGRLRELQRGSTAHGTCGVGVGETVKHGLEHPEQTLRYQDLLHPSLALEKLNAIQDTLCKELGTFDYEELDPKHAFELKLLKDKSIAKQWLTRIDPLINSVEPASRQDIHDRFHQPGLMIMEGAQGVLLDEWRGFHPHTTWSSIHTNAAEDVVRDAGQTCQIRHFGILRIYLTRHGQGPFPTEDSSLNHLPEPHNASHGWQGQFRRGHPDEVLLKYAIDAAGKLDGLLVSHLDVFDKTRLKICTAYEVTKDLHRDMNVTFNAEALVQTLPHFCNNDLNFQSALTELLKQVRPRYEKQLITNVQQFIERLSAVARLNVMYGSFGPASEDVRCFSKL